MQEPIPKLTATVILFKPSGKYYTEEAWEIPTDAIGPYDMRRSRDFRRIDGGAVLVDSDTWGFPHLFPSDGAGQVQRVREAVVLAAEAVVAEAMAAILQEGDEGPSGVLEPV